MHNTCKAFYGCWRLISLEQILVSGDKSMPLGGFPSGLLLYHEDGVVSVQMAVSDPKQFVSENPEEATADEAVAAWRAFFSYWGIFHSRSEEGIVVHSIEGCSYPNWIGTEQIRHFSFEGPNRLTLEAHSSSGRMIAVWQRTAQSVSDHEDGSTDPS